METKNTSGNIHFLIERIALFSDAVIAIALTILIIDIKAPRIPVGASMLRQLDQIKELRLTYFDYLTIPLTILFAFIFGLINYKYIIIAALPGLLLRFLIKRKQKRMNNTKINLPANS